MKISNWWAACSLTLVALISAVPLFFVTYPPLQDLANHLARIVLLTSPDTHPIHQMYQAAWAPIPNLVTDVLLIGFSKILNLAASSKVLIAFSAILWLIAPFLIHKAVYKETSIVPLLAGAFLFNKVLQMGFLNFFFSTGLLGIAFAVWVLLESRQLSLRIVVGASLAVLIYFSHLFTLAVFLIAVTIWEFSLPVAWTHWTTLLRKVTLLGLTAVPALILFVIAPHGGSDGQLFSYRGRGPGLLGILALKIENFGLFLSAGPVVSLILIIVLTIIVVASIIWNRRQLDRRLGYIALVLFLIFFALPQHAMGGANVDWRMLAPLTMFLFGWLRWPMKTHQTLGFVLACTSIVIAEVTLVTKDWAGAEAQYRQFSELIAKVPERSWVVYAQGKVGPQSVTNQGTLRNNSGFLVIERESVVPFLFSDPTQQPMEAVPAYGRKARSLQAVFAGKETDPLALQKTAPFNYFVLASLREPAVSDKFKKIYQSGIFILYKVERPSWAPPIQSLS